MYLYINVRSDFEYSTSAPVERIESVLNKRLELKSEGHRKYSNTRGFPWISVSVINCDSSGNYPSQLDQESSSANMIEFACSYPSDGEQEKLYIQLAKAVALELNWEVVNGQSNRVY
jgi:hypothetical protein